MSNNHIIDVDFEENKYYTLEEVSKITELTDGEILFYYKKLNNFLKIQSIGMYQIFSATDIDNLKKVKSLSDKGMSISEIEKYLKNNQQEVLMNKENEMIDVSFLQFFASILEVQNNKIEQVININTKLVELINEKFSNTPLLEQDPKVIQENIENTINKAIDNKFNNFDNILNEKLDDIDDIIDEKLNDITNAVKEEIRFSYASKEDIEKYKKKRTFKEWFFGKS